MKTKITPTSQHFAPVTISITIETIAEAAALFTRFNVPVAIVKQYGLAHIDNWPLGQYIDKHVDYSHEDSFGDNNVYDLLEKLLVQQFKKEQNQ